MSFLSSPPASSSDCESPSFEARRQKALAVVNTYKFLDLCHVPVENKAFGSKRVAAVIAMRQWAAYNENGRPPLPDPDDSAISKREWEVLIVEAKATVHRREYRRRLCHTMYNSPLYARAGSPIVPNCFDDALTEEDSEAQVHCVESAMVVAASVRFPGPNEMEQKTCSGSNVHVPLPY